MRLEFYSKKKKYVVFIVTIFFFLDGSDQCMLGEVMKKLTKLSSRANQCTLDVMMAPVLMQLQSAQSAWNASSNFTQQLPDYSYAPLEYITQVSLK